MSDVVISSRAAEPVGPYPHARRVGDLLFLSGVGSRIRGQAAVPGEDFEVQCRQVFANVRAILEDSGSDWERMVDVTVYLTHLQLDFPIFNRLWLDAFPDAATRPTRTTLEVASLPTPIDIELQGHRHADPGGPAVTAATDHTHELDELAAALEGAERTRRPIDQISAGRPWLGPVQAYGIQERLVAARIAQGETLVGWKVGLTSAAMQQQLGVDQPDYGAILSGWMVPDGAVLPTGAFIAARVEAEICFRLARSLRGPGVTAAEVLAATESVSPALEIIDSRIRDWRLTLVDTIADMASSARIVVSEERVSPRDLELRAVTVEMTRDDQIVATGVGAACLGDPAAAVAWAANTLGALGVTLEAGQIVMPGALHAAAPVGAGSIFRASFAGLGSVSIRFSGATAS